MTAANRTLVVAKQVDQDCLKCLAIHEDVRLNLQSTDSLTVDDEACLNWNHLFALLCLDSRSVSLSAAELSWMMTG